MTSLVSHPDVLAAQARIDAAVTALAAATDALTAAPDNGDFKKAKKAATKAKTNAEKDMKELPVVAQATLDAETAVLAVAEAALAASPDDGKLKKAVKKLSKNVTKAEKGLKLALKKHKGNEWDGGEETKSDKAKERRAAKAAKVAEKAAKAAAKASELPWVNPTPTGQKKDTSGDMPQEYLPERVEAAWGEWWEAEGFFSPNAEEALKKDPDERFTIVIPPPNVTGSLHIGHALTIAIEDAVVRWHRMQGKSVLWLPGTDHAGIATQTQVEKLLMKETGQTKHDIGREALLKKIWEWKEKKGGRITTQIRKLGASVDWKREVFTMDSNLSVAVTEAFVRMYEKGLIYRQKRLVNWCSKLNTAISDIEVDHDDLKGRTLKTKVPGHDLNHEYEFGVIISFAYKVEGLDEEIVVATTRLETMLGDTAVAVHPEDPRYKHLHGKRLIHPFRPESHPHKTIPLVLDDVLVDMAFGTGAVKITPAHDPNDYECGKRHGLDAINILDDSGAINVNGGDAFAGAMRFDAREQILAQLTDLGLYRGTENNAMQLPICSRSGDIVEPRLKPQWFVNTTSMAARALKSVEDGELKLIPADHKHVSLRMVLFSVLFSVGALFASLPFALLLSLSPSPALPLSRSLGRTFVFEHGMKKKIIYIVLTS
jgi:valyl-tRNA synthetase